MKKIITLLAIAFYSLSTQAQYKIDSTFNLNGTNEFTEFAGNIVNGEKLAYTASNDIIVAGRWNDQLTVWKYHQTGNLDSTFGHNGLNYIPMPSGTSTWVKNVLIQTDGKIVVLAESEWVSFPDYAYSQSFIVLARFLPDGTIDSTFNSTGLVNRGLVPSYEYHPMCLALDTLTNSLFVGGWVIDWGSYQCPSGLGHWFIAKFMNNGTLDNSFNSTGFIQETSFDIAQTTLTPLYPMARVLDIKSLGGGKVLAAGAFNPLDSIYFSLKLKASGNYDSTYALNGRNVVKINSFHIMPTATVKILNNQSIIYNSILPTLGSVGIIDTSDVYVYKQDSLGNTQTTFGTGGYLILHQLASQIKMTTDNQNRIIYTWYNSLPAGTQSIYFRRLNPYGATDMSFGAGGILTSHPFLSDPYMNRNTMNDIEFNKANDDITLVSWRSASYDPTTFRISNYSLDPNFVPTTGISSFSRDNAISVYPNPSQGTFIIETKNVSFYKIYNSSGIMVGLGKLIPGKNNIELSIAAKGIYFVQIVDSNNNCASKKIIVQ